MFFLKKRVFSTLSFNHLYQLSRSSIWQKRSLIGWALHFFDHIETTIYLALGPLLLFSHDTQSQTLWIFGLFSGALGKFAFSVIWGVFFRFFGLKNTLWYSWCALSLSSFLFGLYGLCLDQDQALNLSVFVVFRFVQSLCSNAQNHACHAWVFTPLTHESKETCATSAFFGLSAPLGILCGLAIMLAGSFLFPVLTFWPWVYLSLGLIAISLSWLLKRYIKEDEIKKEVNLFQRWPNFNEIATCALASGFGYCTYYWACIFLPTQLIAQEAKLMAQTKAMAYDCLLILPMGLFSTYLGSKTTFRLASFGCLGALLLAITSSLSLSLLRPIIMILGVLASCSYSVWIKNRLRSESFFSSSLIGGSFGALLGSGAFYCAQIFTQENLAIAALPFVCICLLIVYLNEAVGFSSAKGK